MMNFTPRTAVEALRYAKSAAKAKDALNNVEFVLWFNGDICTVDSWKVRGGLNVCDQYTVHIEAGTCDCKDFAEKGSFCKHTIAVNMDIDAADEAVMWDAICAKVEAEEALSA